MRIPTFLLLGALAGCMGSRRVVMDERDAGCGQAASGFAERLQFKRPDGGIEPLLPSPSPLPAVASLGWLAPGPTANPMLCFGGCAGLTVEYRPGTPAGLVAGVMRVFEPPVDLVHTRIAFSITIEQTALVPIALTGYTAAEVGPGAAKERARQVSGAALAPYTAGDIFRDVELFPSDNPETRYCASATKVVGLELSNTDAITEANAGRVILYLNALTIHDADVSD